MPSFFFAKKTLFIMKGSTLQKIILKETQTMEKETNITKEELVQETEVIEEEALKADKMKTKKILKKILIGTGAAAIIGGIIAAVRANSKDYESDYLDKLDDDSVNRTEVERTEICKTEVETIDPNGSESN